MIELYLDLDGGVMDLPFDIELAVPNAKRKVWIWNIACELAEQHTADPFAYLGEAVEILRHEEGPEFDPPISHGIDTDWGSNSSDALAIAHEHEVFLQEPPRNQVKILEQILAYKTGENEPTPGLDGGWIDLPPDLQGAIVNSTRKLEIWNIAEEIASQKGGQTIDHLTDALDIFFSESHILDPPPSFGLETDWGVNQLEAETIVQEHRTFLASSESRKRSVLKAMKKHRNHRDRQSRLKRSR